MKFFTERRLIAFSGGPGGAPPGGPEKPEDQEQQERLELDDIMNALDSGDAKAAVQEAEDMANSDQENAREKTYDQLQKAAQLEFTFLTENERDINGDGIEEPPLSAEEALAEVEADFQKIDTVQFRLDAGKLVVEVGKRAPRNKEEQLTQQMEEAEAILSDPNATWGEKLAAFFKMLGSIRQMWDGALDGSLADPVDDPNARDREQRAKEREARAKRAEKLREKVAAAGGDVDKVRTDLEAKKTTLEKDVEDKKKVVTDKEQELTSLKAELQTEVGKKENANESRVNELKEQVKQLEQDIIKAKDELAKAESDLTMVEADLEGLVDLKAGVDALQQKLKDTILPKLTKAFSVFGPEYANLFDGADVTINNKLQPVITKGGKPLTALLEEKIASLKTDLEAKGVETGKMDGLMDSSGLDGTGAITDFSAFNAFLLQLGTTFSTKAEELNKAIAKEITEGLEGSNIPTVNHEDITKALAAPGTWVENGDIATVFVGGRVYIQTVQGNSAGLSGQMVVDNGGTLELQDIPSGEYLSREKGSLQSIPQYGNDDDRERGYTYENNDWRQKTLVEIADTGNLSTDATEAIRSPGSWISGTFGSGKAYEMVFKDGQIYANAPDGNDSWQFSIDDYIESGDENYDNLGDQYFDGSSVVDLPESSKDARERGHKYEDHKWTAKSRTEIVQYMKDDIDFTNSDLNSAFESAIDSPNSWATSGDFDVLFDGSDLYYQQGEPVYCGKLDFNEYVEKGGTSPNLWEMKDGKYLDGSGNEKDVPDTDTHEYDREKKEWVYSEDKALDQFGTDKDKVKSHLNDTEWSKNSVNSNLEGIRIENKIYIQAVNSPDKVTVYDLDTGDMEVETGRYVNGAGEMQDVPPADVSNYDTDTNTWTELSDKQVESRSNNRVEAGVRVLDDSGVDYEKDGTNRYRITLPGDGDKMLVRFNDTSDAWEYKPEGSDQGWIAASDGLTEEAMDWWDGWTTVNTEANRKARQIIDGLNDASLVEEFDEEESEDDE